MEGGGGGGCSVSDLWYEVQECISWEGPHCKTHKQLQDEGVGLLTGVEKDEADTEHGAHCDDEDGHRTVAILWKDNVTDYTQPHSGSQSPLESCICNWRGSYSREQWALILSSFALQTHKHCLTTAEWWLGKSVRSAPWKLANEDSERKYPPADWLKNTPN